MDGNRGSARCSIKESRRQQRPIAGLREKTFGKFVQLPVETKTAPPFRGGAVQSTYFEAVWFGTVKTVS